MSTRKNRFQRRRIGDEAALHFFLTCKGASGLRPCMLCKNVFKIGENDARDLEAKGAVMYFEADKTKLKPHTRASIRWIRNRLAAAHPLMSKTAFAELETQNGWNYSVHSVIADDRLLDIVRPWETVTFDWMHVAFVTGVWNHLVGDMVHVGGKLDQRISYDAFDEYCKRWSWPDWIEDFNEVFSESRALSHKAAGHVKATASEGLSACPVYKRLVSSSADPDRPHSAATLAMIPTTCANRAIFCAACRHYNAQSRYSARW